MEALAAYLLLGVLAGVSAGLLGIGGGLIIVPVLLAIWQQGGVDSPWLMQMAIATSLASIVFTSVSSVRAHHWRGVVLWPQVRRLAPGILLGAGLRAMQASWLSGQWLRVGFGAFELLVAASVLFAPLGARLAYRLSGLALKRVFALVLALLGLWMLLD